MYAYRVIQMEKPYFWGYSFQLGMDCYGAELKICKSSEKGACGSTYTFINRSSSTGFPELESLHAAPGGLHV